jgi:hypothetical protein
MLRNLGRLQQPLKQAKHGALAKTGALQQAVLFGTPRSTTRQFLGTGGADKGGS